MQVTWSGSSDGGTVRTGWPGRALGWGLALALLGATPTWAQNLIVNGDAEAGDLTGWVDATGHGFTLADGVTGRAPYAGEFSFWAGPSGAAGPLTNRLIQDVDLFGFAELIDLGQCRSYFSGVGLSSEDELAVDPASVEVSYFAADGSVLAHYASGDLVPTNSWVAFADERPVPVGVRSIRVALDGARTTGVSTDAYFDALQLDLDCTVECRDLLFAMGGIDEDEEPIDRVDVYDPETGTWSVGAPMPKPLAGHSAAVGSDGRVYVFGGGVEGDVASEVFSYDPSSDSWSNDHPWMPTPRRLSSAIAADDGLIYVYGGQDADEDPLAVIEAFDPVSNSWEVRTPPEYSRTDGGAGFDFESLYFMSGDGDDPAITDRYDPYADSWECLLDYELPDPRPGVGSATGPDGFIYLFGGDGSDAVDVWDTDDFCWDDGPELEQGRDNVEATALGNLIHVMGGGSPDEGFFADHEVLDVDDWSWTSAPPMPFGRPEFTLVTAEACDSNCTAELGLLHVGVESGLDDVRAEVWLQHRGVETSEVRPRLMLLDAAGTIVGQRVFPPQRFRTGQLWTTKARLVADLEPGEYSLVFELSGMRGWTWRTAQLVIVE